MNRKATEQRSHRTEREFGVIVGGIFALLSVWWLYRGKFPEVSWGTLVLGIVLVFLAIVFPGSLVYPNKLWMGLAGILAYISTRVILAFVFFFVITPIGVIKRLFGWDPLHRRAALSESYWHDYSERQRDTKHYEKMY